jgi:hypothetical protein
MARELVKHQVAVIAATGGSVSGLAAKKVTTTIPIVLASGGDAVKLGLVSNLSRPSGNVTGVDITFGALGVAARPDPEGDHNRDARQSELPKCGNGDCFRLRHPP